MVVTFGSPIDINGGGGGVGNEIGKGGIKNDGERKLQYDIDKTERDGVDQIRAATE